jgi:hypothetical protein
MKTLGMRGGSQTLLLGRIIGKTTIAVLDHEHASRIAVSNGRPECLRPMDSYFVFIRPEC